VILNLTEFSSRYFTPAMIIVGSIGNLFGLIVISKKKLTKIGPKIIYISLFISDMIALAFIFQLYALSEFNLNITVISSLYFDCIFNTKNIFF